MCCHSRYVGCYLDVHGNMIAMLCMLGDKGIANRARQLSTPKAHIARPNCNESRIRVLTVC
jgi:hypothetical protein